MASFRAVVLRGPDIEKDGLSSWTAKDLCRIVEQRYKVSYSENGMLKLLHSLDLSWQKTRPVQPKSDPRAQADFKKKFRGLIAETAAAHPEAANGHSGRIEGWLQDEARIGQTGRNCRPLRGLLTASPSEIG